VASKNVNANGVTVVDVAGLWIKNFVPGATVNSKRSTVEVTMLLRKGKRNQVCMLPTTGAEALALAGLMKSYKKFNLVTFLTMNNKARDIDLLMVGVSEEAGASIAKAVGSDKFVHN